ncbi:MAG: DISARM system SNF2-like helicase DrmD [archaeon]
MNIPIPHPGQMVIVRSRPAIVKDIKVFHSKTGETTHTCLINYIDGHLFPEADYIIWESEQQARIIHGVSLPDIATTRRPDSPDSYFTFLNSYRWSASIRIDELTGRNSQDGVFLSPWQSAIHLEQYQLFPLLKAFSLPRITLLLADDVGLGKTIEAGLILNELISRGKIRRMLILCPAALQIQWRDEMSDKFYIDFTIVNRETTFQLQKEFGADVNPWSSFSRIITSMDYLRQRDVLENFQSATESFVRNNNATLPWDMLIVDEAHNISAQYAGRDTERLRMVRQINPHFEHRVFLTATPHNGYTQSFTGMLELLNPLIFEQKPKIEPKDSQFINEYVIRRLKSDFSKEAYYYRFTERKILRIDHFLSKKFTLYSDEHELFQSLKSYKEKAQSIVRNLYPGKRFIINFLIQLLTKRLLSSVFAFANTWWNHYSGIGEQNIDESDVDYAIQRTQAELTDDAERDLREEEAVRKIGSWLYQHANELRMEIEQINQRLGRLAWSKAQIEKGCSQLESHLSDSKWNALIGWIDAKLKNGSKFRADERVIIFTEYKHTLDYLLTRFQSIGIESPIIETLCGESSHKQREDIKHYFTDDDSPLRILLVTDVASEGLNLQNNCRYVVHYEIPWNPMRLEQRNGRVDRFGQSRDVEIFTFITDEEQDLQFLEKVVHKVEQIREDIGNVADLFDRSLEDYFLGTSSERGRAQTILDKLQPDSFPNSDLNGSASGSTDEYEKAFQQIIATKTELEINPINLARILQTAFAMEGGNLITDPEMSGVFQIGTVPPKWKNIVKDTLEITRGKKAGGWYKLVFDPDYFEKIENGRLVYLNKPDTKYISLGHPLMRRAIALIKRQLWDTESGISGSSQLSRFTIMQADLPEGIDEIVVVSLLIEATNTLKETIHEQVLQIPLIVNNRSLRHIDPPVWNSLKSISKVSLSELQLTKIFGRFQNNWMEIESSLKDMINQIKREKEEDFRSRLTNSRKTALEETIRIYNDRLAELKSHRQPRYIEKIKKEIEEKRLQLMAPSVFEEENIRQQHEYLEYQQKLEQSLNENTLYLESILLAEKERMLNRTIPQRYELNHCEVFPLGVEFIMAKRIADSV